jgi:nucleoside-diphosphate-sugar epimerase
MARILVIGGTGFIGAFVVRELVQMGHEVGVFHRGSDGAAVPRSVRRIIGDRRRLVESAAEIRALGPEIIVDLILSSGAQANELMTTVRGMARRVVALSSMDVYRACGVLHRLEPLPLEPMPLRETSPLRTKLEVYPPAQVAKLKQTFGWLDDAYDKIPVEQAILGDPDLPGTVLRLPMVYGPGDRLHRFFPILKRIDDGRRVLVFEEKQARFRSPRGYVENVAEAIVLAATTESAAGRVYNVAESESVSEIDWARLIGHATGWPGEFVVLPFDRAPAHLRNPANLDQHWVPDTTRIREELGYRELIAREEAIRRTIEWERRNPPAQIDERQFDYGAEDAALSG